MMKQRERPSSIRLLTRRVTIVRQIKKRRGVKYHLTMTRRKKKSKNKKRKERKVVRNLHHPRRRKNKQRLLGKRKLKSSVGNAVPKLHLMLSSALNAATNKNMMLKLKTKMILWNPSNYRLQKRQ